MAFTIENAQKDPYLAELGITAQAYDFLTPQTPEAHGAKILYIRNVLHDWDVPQCETLLKRCAAALPPGGRVLIHDVYLNDALDGPLPLALYSAALFSLTEGRAYLTGASGVAVHG